MGPEMETDRFDRSADPAALYRLSNGRYQVRLSEVGSGGVTWNGLALTRWRDDPVMDDLGSILYLRDLETGAFWSVGYQPTRAPAEVYRWQVATDRLTLERVSHDLAVRLGVEVDAALDLERRWLRLENRSSEHRRIEVTSYLEVVLNDRNADHAHPAFSKLFVQTERDPDTGALLAWRRPRSADESWPWLAHAARGAEVTAWETDRRRFIGRGQRLAKPIALTDEAPLSGSLGPVLDPVLSLRCIVALAPGEATEVLFLTAVGATRESALALLGPHPTDAPLGVGVVCASTADAPAIDTATTLDDAELRFFNGYGGFSASGREYVIRLPWRGDRLHRPPQPWINVIANERAGCLVSETGAGYAWCRNSQANRLTPWSNDPVSDPHGEAIYLRDESSGEVWSPLPGPRPAPTDYEVRHGFGVTRFRCEYLEIVQETSVFVPRSDPLRILRLRLEHRGMSPRRLSVFSYLQPVLGTQARSPSPIVTDHDRERDLLRATNPDAGDFSGAILFAAAGGQGMRVGRVRHLRDRVAFVGYHRDLADPALVCSGGDLDGGADRHRDPCLAHQIELTLAPGETAECVFLLGECLDEAELDACLVKYRRPGAIADALAKVQEFWEDLVSRLQVETPSPAIDLMLNGWLTYQNLVCRQWARSAFYQSGGAYGYRDQLQDAAALVAQRPDLTRAQILLHAAHQLVEGDVLHWWHPAPLGRGLRTRFSDDLLWLPLVTADYIRATGEVGILDERLPFIAARALAPGEDEAYLAPTDSDESADLYEHCCRAIDRSLTAGAHGLPLMGTGDWNDGMNRVGRRGRGESVWLGFFLYRIIGDFLPHCAERGDAARVARYGRYREALARALEDAGWDGDWYRRAFDDEGRVLGSRASDGGRIDALAQAWSVISGAVDPGRAARAMAAVELRLIDDDIGLVRLLAPPFVATALDPGYIKGYVAGVRENGGQYTHAACWVVIALAMLGQRERAATLLERLTPVWHTTTPERVATYGLEPYVVAADIYGEPPHLGRGGWSWYTGSAGWLQRAALEFVLGLRIEGGRTLVIRPCIPDDWPGFRVRYRLADGVTDCAIGVVRAHDGHQVVAARLDGRQAPILDGAARIELPEGGGRHRIDVSLGSA